MKKCKTVKGLVHAIVKGEFAILKVYDIMRNDFDQEGVYLNLGGGSTSYVGGNSWRIIKNNLIDPDGYFCKDLRRFRPYYEQKTSINY